MTFTESNTIEAYLCDLLTGGITDQPTAPVGLAQQGLGWHFLASTALGRQPQQVFPPFRDHPNRYSRVPRRATTKHAKVAKRGHTLRPALFFRAFRAFRSSKSRLAGSAAANPYDKHPSKSNYETRESREKESTHPQTLPFRAFRVFRVLRSSKSCLASSRGV